MKTNATLAGGVLLLLLGVVGCPKAPTPAPPPAPMVPTGVALGEQVFKTGIGASGTHVPFTKGGDKFRAEPGGCIGCHGEDGRGKQISDKERIPAITYPALREPIGGQPPMFSTDEAVHKAVTQGVEEDGEEMSPVMPRWQLTDEEFAAVVTYLKKLSEGQPPIEATHEHEHMKYEHSEEHKTK
jgi:mono/diheme cytochrome c family protein